MQRFFSNPRVTSLSLLMIGLAIIGLDLARHPDEWKNWLTRLGIMLIFIVILFVTVHVIRFLKNRKFEK